jgi:cell division protein FtsI (penicillin-binding protein 3)
LINADKSIKVDGLEKSIIDKCKQRIIAIAVIFFVAFITVNIKLIEVSKPLKAKDYSNKAIKINSKRGDILDRNGNIVAVSMPSWSLYKNKNEIYDKENTVNVLLNLIPELNKSKLKKILTEDKNFQYIARHLSPNIAKKINKIGEPALNFEKEYLRVYPYNEEISHIVGYVGTEKDGLAGVEKKYNDILNEGKNINLTIDTRVQFRVYQALTKGIELYKYKAAVGIVLEINTGEVIAGVSLPSFDPNVYASFLPTKNQITNSVYEMGSIFKSFTVASALNDNLVTNESKFDVRKPLRLRGKTITDYHGENRILDLEEVFTYSSNIGTAQIAQKLGKDRQYSYYKNLGFNKPLDTGIFESVNPVVIPQDKVKELDLVLMSYGHSINISPMHAISALAATLNQGEYIEPMVVKDDQYANRPRIKVYSTNVTEIMKKYYRNVVVEGTAKKVQSKLYKVGGKTGTSNKFINGKQNHKKVVSSFISFFPIDEPKYAVFILLDEPKALEETRVWGRTAGFNAVPITKEIITNIAPILGVKSNNYNEL